MIFRRNCQSRVLAICCINRVIPGFCSFRHLVVVSLLLWSYSMMAILTMPFFIWKSKYFKVYLSGWMLDQISLDKSQTEWIFEKLFWTITLWKKRLRVYSSVSFSVPFVFHRLCRHRTYKLLGISFGKTEGFQALCFLSWHTLQRFHIL